MLILSSAIQHYTAVLREDDVTSLEIFGNVWK